ncbi:MAG: Na+/H+ antiporter NhaC family protein [Candidatus Eiseniibacteriota bacterium]
MRRLLVKFAVTAALVASLALLPGGDREYLYRQTIAPLTDRALDWVASRPGFDALESIDVAIVDGALLERPGSAEPALRTLWSERLEEFGDAHALAVTWRGVHIAPPELSLTFRKETSDARLIVVWRPPGAAPERAELHQPYFRPLALLPPLVAIALALTFRQTLLALFAGVWIGATLVPWFESAMTLVTAGTTAGDGAASGPSGWPNPLLGLWRFASVYLWKQSIQSTFRIEIIGFVAVLIAAVGVMTRGGAIAGMISVILRFARTVRTTRLATALMGLVIFFDDYTNTIVVGNTMRPLTDRMRISREKLAYLVDSTAAPVAGLMVLSTWVAYEVSQFEPQLAALGVERDPYAVFLATIPYRFYCLFTLFFVFATTVLGRDFGPMLAAERRAARSGRVIRDGGRPLVSARATDMTPRPGTPERPWNALLPLGAVIVVTLVEIVRLGALATAGPVDLLDVASLREVLGNTDTVRALFRGSLAGWLLAVALHVGQRILSVRDCLEASLRAAGGVVFALAILLLAWSIGGVCHDLGTAHVLIALCKGTLSPLVLPVVLFLLSCAVSFSTGSSWSTMAIILPNTVMLAFTLGETFPGGPMALTVMSIGAVLEGSIFGDHCSPLSDTTILSSVASASDHIDHVRTQMPYAITTMLAAILLGYVPSVLGLHPAIGLAGGAAALTGFLLLVGRDPDRDRTGVS